MSEFVGPPREISNIRDHKDIFSFVKKMIIEKGLKRGEVIQSVQNDFGVLLKPNQFRTVIYSLSAEEERMRYKNREKRRNKKEDEKKRKKEQLKLARQGEKNAIRQKKEGVVLDANELYLGHGEGKEEFLRRMSIVEIKEFIKRQGRNDIPSDLIDEVVSSNRTGHEKRLMTDQIRIEKSQVGLVSEKERQEIKDFVVKNDLLGLKVTDILKEVNLRLRVSKSKIEHGFLYDLIRNLPAYKKRKKEGKKPRKESKESLAFDYLIEDAVWNLRDMGDECNVNSVYKFLQRMGGVAVNVEKKHIRKYFRKFKINKK